MLKNPIRFLVILPIRIYQLCISPFIPPSCRFYPTCSAYAAEAVAVHGVFAGLWLALRRILRCHPFNEGGWDPVPPLAQSSPGPSFGRREGRSAAPGGEGVSGRDL